MNSHELWKSKKLNNSRFHCCGKFVNVKSAFKYSFKYFLQFSDEVRQAIRSVERSKTQQLRMWFQELYYITYGIFVLFKAQVTFLYGKFFIIYMQFYGTTIIPLNFKTFIDTISSKNKSPASGQVRGALIKISPFLDIGIALTSSILIHCTFFWAGGMIL